MHSEETPPKLDAHQGDPVIDAILKPFYRPDRILAQKVEQIDGKNCKVTFKFPAYGKTIQQLDHVSVVQMQEAVVEGLYIAIGLAVKNNPTLSNLTFEEFEKRLGDVLYVQDEASYRQKLPPESEATLTFKVLDPRLKGGLTAVTVEVDGFTRRKVTCFLTSKSS